MISIQFWVVQNLDRYFISFTENVERRFKAYGWHTEKLADGYDLKAIEKAIANAKKVKDKPSILIVRTHIGHGSPAKQDSPGAHGSPLGADEIKLVKKNLGLPNKSFHIPADVMKHMRKAVPTGKKNETAWNVMFKSYKMKYPRVVGYRIFYYFDHQFSCFSYIQYPS